MFEFALCDERATLCDGMKNFANCFFCGAKLWTREYAREFEKRVSREDRNEVPRAQSLPQGGDLRILPKETFHQDVRIEHNAPFGRHPQEER